MKENQEKFLPGFEDMANDKPQKEEMDDKEGRGDKVADNPDQLDFPLVMSEGLNAEAGIKEKVAIIAPEGSVSAKPLSPAEKIQKNLSDTAKRRGMTIDELRAEASEDDPRGDIGYPSK